MKLFLKIILPVLLIGILVWFAMGRLRTEVPVAAAVRGTAVDAVTGTIEVTASYDLTLKTEVNGRVEAFVAEVGSRLEAGDEVARLASEEASFRLRQQEVRLENARARHELPFAEELELINAREAVESLRLSVAGGLTSTQELERALRNLERLEASLEAERIARRERLALLDLEVDFLRHQLERMTLRSPYTGILVEQNVVEGDWLWANNSVARIVSEERSVEMVLSEEDFHGIEPGQRATLRLAGFPGRTFEGTVDSLGLTADPDSKTRNVYLTVEESSDVLIPGLTGEGVLTKAQRENTVIVPRRALIGQVLYVVRDERVEIRPVRAGFLSLNKAEILEGLEPGEWVILEGQRFLREGQRVRSLPR